MDWKIKTIAKNKTKGQKDKIETVGEALVLKDRGIILIKEIKKNKHQNNK